MFGYCNCSCHLCACHTIHLATSYSLQPMFNRSVTLFTQTIFLNVNNKHIDYLCLFFGRAHPIAAISEESFGVKSHMFVIKDYK